MTEPQQPAANGGTAPSPGGGPASSDEREPTEHGDAPPDGTAAVRPASSSPGEPPRAEPPPGEREPRPPAGGPPPGEPEPEQDGDPPPGPEHEPGPRDGQGDQRGQGEQQENDDKLAVRLEQLIIGAERMYTPFQAARTAGVPMEVASRFWRAMGFPDIGQAKALTEADVLALRRLAGLVEAGLLSEAMAVQVARSTGQTTARLADWQIDSFLEGLTEPPEPGMSRSEVAYPLVELLLPELEEFLVYVWRRQLAAAAGRVVQEQDDSEMVDRRLAVGFADLVGFTRLTRRLEESELGELVETFEVTAADQVAAQGGRLIKTLGDEVLFAADDAATAASIGLRLVEAMAENPLLPELRVGIAFGTVTTRMGDVFGNTVNLASRLTSIAPKDRVLVDEAMREELTTAGAAPRSEKEAERQTAAGKGRGSGSPPGATEESGGYRFALRPLYQRPVRGLGVVEPWLLTRRS